MAPGHDRGQVWVDVATMLTAGGDAIADIDTLRHQEGVCSARSRRRRRCGGRLMKPSLKGWVFVNRLLTSGFAGFRPPCRQHWVRARGQDGAPAALARTNGLDAGPARCMLSAMPEDQRRDCVVVGSFSMLRWADTLGQGRIGSGCRSSLRPAGVGMERCGGNTRGQSSWRPRRVGGQTVQRPRACCVRGAHPALRARARMCPSRSP